VLEELGYDAARIESLTAGGAVHLPKPTVKP
jgi:hypothetical protein